MQDGGVLAAGKPFYDPAKITAPVLLVVGEWDRDTPPGMAPTLFPLLADSPGKRLVMLAEGTHTIIMERNRGALFQAVQVFLEEASAKSRRRRSAAAGGRAPRPADATACSQLPFSHPSRVPCRESLACRGPFRAAQRKGYPVCPPRRMAPLAAVTLVLVGGCAARRRPTTRPSG